MGKLALFILLLVAVALLGGGVFLAFWGLPVPSTPVEKVIPDARFPR